MVLGGGEAVCLFVCLFVWNALVCYGLFVIRYACTRYFIIHPHLVLTWDRCIVGILNSMLRGRNGFRRGKGVNAVKVVCLIGMLWYTMVWFGLVCYTLCLHEILYYPSPLTV